jgi:hypothetical protein
MQQDLLLVVNVEVLLQAKRSIKSSVLIVKINSDMKEKRHAQNAQQTSQK